MSGHPLDSFYSELNLLATTTSRLKDGVHAENDKVSLLGFVVNNIVRLNQKNEKFAIVTLEDIRGTIEFPVFSKVYQNSSELLESEAPLLVTGRVIFRDEKVGIFIDDIRLVSEVREKDAKSMLIKFGSESLKEEELILLRSILQKYPGTKTFSFSVQTPDSVKVTIIPAEKIIFSSELFQELEELIPSSNLEFGY